MSRPHDTEPMGTPLSEGSPPSSPGSKDDGAAALAAELGAFKGRAPQHAKHQPESAGLSAARYAGEGRPARSHLPSSDATKGPGVIVNVTEPYARPPIRDVGSAPVISIPPGSDPSRPITGRERSARHATTVTRRPAYETEPGGRQRNVALLALVVVLFALVVGGGIVALARAGVLEGPPAPPPASALGPAPIVPTTAPASSMTAAPASSLATPPSAGLSVPSAPPGPSAAATAEAPSSVPARPKPATASPPVTPSAPPRPSPSPSPSTSPSPSGLPEDHVRSI